MTEEKRIEYMKRLEQEYDRFKTDMYLRSPADVFDHAETICNMKYAYDHLRDTSLPEKYLDYIMMARYPLKEIAKTQEAIDAVSYFDNPVKSTVSEICEHQLFDANQVEPYSKRMPIVFHRKVSGISEITELSRMANDDKFTVEKAIILQPSEFESFSNSFMSDHAFIAANKDQMWYDNKNECWHCLMVKDAGSDRAVLVESEGYDYARYTAFVENTRELDLAQIPTEELSKPKGRQRRLARNPER